MESSASTQDNGPDNTVTEKPVVQDDSIESKDQYPSTMQLAIIVFALNLAIFLVGLDNTIISTAIPKITDHFHALDDVGWYASAYLLTTCALQLMWGKLYTFYPIKWAYITTLFLFELGSLICAIAPSSTVLIVGRAIAGIGGGGVGTGSFLLIAHSVPAHKRPTLVGLVGTMYGFASIAGPLVGGALTDNPKLTWRWCFYINLPLGGFAIAVIFFFLSLPSSDKGNKIGFKEQLRQMDLPGTFLILPGVICLLLALQWGGTTYPWKNGRIIALLVLAALLLIGFIIVQVYSGERATVPARIFLQRNIWSSALFCSCVTASFFVMLYYIPIWFQAIKGVSAIKSGVMSLPMVLSFVIFSPLGGSLTTATGYYTPFVYLTVIFMSIGAGLLSTLQVDSGHAEWIGYQVIFGAGVGLGLQAAFSAAQTALELTDVPIGTAIIMFSENLAAAIMVSVAENVFTNQLTKNLVRYVPSIDPQAVIDAGATQLRDEAPPEFYDALLNAYNLSLRQTFYVGVASSCCGVLGAVWVQWLSVKDKKATAPNAPPSA